MTPGADIHTEAPSEPGSAGKTAAFQSPSWSLGHKQVEWAESSAPWEVWSYFSSFPCTELNESKLSECVNWPSQRELDMYLTLTPLSNKRWWDFNPKLSSDLCLDLLALEKQTFSSNPTDPISQILPDTCSNLKLSNFKDLFRSKIQFLGPEFKPKPWSSYLFKELYLQIRKYPREMVESRLLKDHIT